MASYPTAEEEKRLLAYTEEPTTSDDDSQTVARNTSRQHSSVLKQVSRFILISTLVFTCLMAVFGATAMVVVSAMRHSQSCSKHGAVVGVKGGPAAAHGVPVAQAGNANAAGHAHRVGAAAAVSTPSSAFTRLLEAVSPESLHELLHEYFPNSYKHGVYPSEKSALEAIHRANAALATSIVQLARRDLNGTVTSSTPTSSLPPTSTQGTSSKLPTSSAGKNSSTTTKSSSHTTTSSKTTTSSDTQTTGRKVTSVFTSTINGTPTVVTATSVVGVGASNTGTTTGPAGTLQTGAAVAVLAGSSNKARLAEAVAGVLVGALLI